MTHRFKVAMVDSEKLSKFLYPDCNFLPGSSNYHLFFRCKRDAKSKKLASMLAKEIEKNEFEKECSAIIINASVKDTDARRTERQSVI